MRFNLHRMGIDLQISDSDGRRALDYTKQLKDDVFSQKLAEFQRNGGDTEKNIPVNHSSTYLFVVQVSQRVFLFYFIIANVWVGRLFHSISFFSWKPLNYNDDAKSIYHAFAPAYI